MFKAQKKKIDSKFYFAEADGIIQTKEGAVSYKNGDAILTGVKGEQWPIKRDTFEATYVFDVNTGLCFKRPEIVMVEKSDVPFSVNVSWSNDPINGKVGDYRVSNLSGTDTWIVDSDIFNETYDLV